jgi:hypothetical protein
VHLKVIAKQKTMEIKFHSTVILTHDFDKMKAFYPEDNLIKIGVINPSSIL